MSLDDCCGAPALVEASDGLWPRFCVDRPHPAGTEHHLCFRGAVLPWRDGSRVLATKM